MRNVMKRIAFVTYNTIGNLESGWHNGPESRQALVVQNSKCGKWAVDALLDGASVPPPDYKRSETKYADHVRDEIGKLWEQLQKALPDLDHVVVYVGSKGSERAIALAAQLSPSKVTFVGCVCGLLVKEALIQAAGMAGTRRMLCECGGGRTLERLYRRFMETGELSDSGE